MKHTKSVHLKLEDAKQLVTGEQMNADNMKLKLQELAQRRVQPKDVVNVLSKLLKIDDTNEMSGKTANKVEDIVKLYAMNDNNAFPEVAGTAYNLLNAITQYTDHMGGVRRRTVGSREYSEDELRATSSLFGTGVAFKEQALDLILMDTANNQRIIQPSIGRVFVPISDPRKSTGSSLLDEIADSTVHQA
jgi:hypothetical protein